MAPRTLVTFHAHPDDESLLTAGLMAKTDEAGDRVVLVVATGGEVGQVAGDFLVEGEALGERRRTETEQSAAVLGVDRLEFLGYADSGDDPDRTDRPEGAFADADLDEAAGRLAAILRAEDADVVTIYDPNGGYGHPDHLQVHRVGHRAAELAGTPLVLEATINRDLMQLGLELAGSLGFEFPPDFAPPDFSTWYSPADAITHTIDVSGQLDRKRASMEAHASQASSATNSVRSLAVFLSLPPEYFALAFGTEWYIDRTLPPGSALDDVFARLDPGSDPDPVA